MSVTDAPFASGQISRLPIYGFSYVRRSLVCSAILYHSSDDSPRVPHNEDDFLAPSPLTVALAHGFAQGVARMKLYMIIHVLLPGSDEMVTAS
jgi:hypothetical protein